MTLTIWHNPRCTKSRQTLALLEARGLTPEIRRYLDAPPTEAEIRAALKALGLPAISLLRSKESLFSDLGLTTDSSDETLIAAMAAHPRLIERPLVLHGDRAALGRPPESVLAIL
ncbi:arsenate reductase [Defluviimonas sp. 20V17]|uniref:Arsenate reductase n=1 Tax=Allgaiera indica TaxID=765699 RepID=A0AAN4UU86_9RHOB|nr:arsenate reductase (glutaredoxin) [Allgaiera indica]KDB05146.1 arsenate reductase [Defluviimonas sp. 20V17]GHE05336.1 arsenate reductase [Allgaiera indica]SDX63545.1 arsenate reductase [Allgaiera indica]